MWDELLQDFIESLGPCTQEEIDFAIFDNVDSLGDAAEEYCREILEREEQRQRKLKRKQKHYANLYELDFV